MVKVKIQERLKIAMTVHLDNSSTAEPFVTKHSIVAHHHGPECHAEILVCYCQCQSHSEGSYNQI